MIEQAGSHFNETASKIGETLKGTQDTAPVFVDTKTAKLLHDMGAQTNPQLKLELIDLPTRRYKTLDIKLLI